MRVRGVWPTVIAVTQLRKGIRMNRVQFNQCRKNANRMEVMLLVVTAVALGGTLFAFYFYGVMLSLAFLILGAVALGLSQVFDLLGDLFSAIASLSEKKASQVPKDATPDAGKCA